MGIFGFLKRKKIFRPRNYSEKMMIVDERHVKVIKRNGSITVMDGNREIFDSEKPYNNRRAISFQQWLKIQKANEIW